MTFPTPQRQILTFHGKAFFVAPKWQNKLADIGLSADQDWKLLQSNDAVSGSYNTTCSFRFMLDDNESIYFKRYVYKKPRIKSFLQPSKAQTEAAGLTELKTMNIPTIDVIAYGEERVMGLLKAAFIVTRGIDKLQMMDRYVATVWHRMLYHDKKEVLHRLQSVLVKQLQTVHQQGFYHWDLKLRNLLLQQPDKPDARIIWIDCPRSRRRTANNMSAIAKDFSAMARVGRQALTPGQRFAFLLDYFNGDRNKARELFGRVAQALQKNPPRPLWHVLDKDDPEFQRRTQLEHDRNR